MQELSPAGYFYRPIRVVFFFLITIYFWLCWVFVAADGLSLVVDSRRYSVSVGGLLIVVVSYGRAQALGVKISVAGHRLSCSVACGIFPDQGLNSCPLNWHVHSYSVCYQGSPTISVFTLKNHVVPPCSVSCQRHSEPEPRALLPRAGNWAPQDAWSQLLQLMVRIPRGCVTVSLLSLYYCSHGPPDLC